MWEDAAARYEPENGSKRPERPAPNVPDVQTQPAQRQKGQNAPGAPAGAGENYVLWAQLLLCGLALGAVLAAKALDLPVFRELRVAYTAAMQEQSPFLGEERQFTKFAQSVWAALDDAAKAVWARLEPPGAAAPANTAPAAVHTKPERKTPSGCRTESYLPDFDLTFPLPTESWVTSDYGWRTDPVAGEGDDFHTGMDLHADEGTPVLAAADGVVRKAGRGVTYGNYLRVLHANGDETLYAHMQYLFVRSGQSVKAGEVLGTVGHTGNVTGPHLHFELLHQGWRFDPGQALWGRDDAA